MSIMNTFREALGYEPDDESGDEKINALSPMDKFRLVMQWELGDPTWAEQMKEWMEECGFHVEEEAPKG